MSTFRCVLSLVLIVAIVGCRPKAKPAMDFNAPLPPGKMALRKIPMERWPDFSGQMTGQVALLTSIDNSLKYLAAPSSKNFFPYDDVDHPRAVATLRAMRQIAAQSNPDWNQELRQKFEVYQSIGAPMPDGTGYSGQVLFTGYHTPTYKASRTRTGPYQWPLYKRPKDAPPMGSAAPVTKLTRAQIDVNPSPFAGNELVFLASRWEGYVIQIQGSARLLLADNSILEIGYAGVNSHEHFAVVQRMVDEGAIPRDQMNLKGMAGYFAAHPEMMDKYLNLNPRYVFFTERPGGPFGSLNVPITPFASIATDKGVYPRAMPAFLVVPIPTAGGGPAAPHRGFMLDQDTGGAIRAAGRCDIYMGRGSEAEARAGHQLHEGQLYYIAVRTELVGQYIAADK